MPQISAVIITYNEERNIARCLDSVRDVVDEIVIVDSFSTDGTKEACRPYGVRFVQHIFEGHIEQKNFAITQARFQHVLSLDADEALSDELRESIKALKGAWSYNGYRMNRLTNYCGAWIRHAGWYPDRKIRLFHRAHGSWRGINPHDRYELDDVNEAVGQLRGDILHYSYNTISDHVKQVDYFTGISATQLRNQGKRASLLRMLVAPAFRLFRDYVIKLGVLDGYYGLVICIISSHAVFLKYAKLRQLYDTR